MSRPKQQILKSSQNNNLFQQKVTEIIEDQAKDIMKTFFAIYHSTHIITNNGADLSTSVIIETCSACKVTAEALFKENPKEIYLTPYEVKDVTWIKLLKGMGVNVQNVKLYLDKVDEERKKIRNQQRDKDIRDIYYDELDSDKTV